MNQGCFRKLNLLDHYATNRNDLIAEFYSPCLDQSTAYDRAVGYFHSSILLLAAQSVANFALRKGKIRLLCSPELTKEDITAFEKGYEWREQIGEALLRSIDQMLEYVSGKSILEFVATLIAVGCLDVRIAFRPGALGIFHDKIGILNDGDGHTISFTGSSNETFRAWDVSGNHESFDVFCSWTADASRVASHTNYFNSLWNDKEPGIETIEFPHVARERLVAISNPAGIAAAYDKVTHSRRDGRKIPQEHQVTAVETWEQQGQKGILQHATGSGKTITAITAMRKWLKLGHPVLVLVPSELLLHQWLRETQSELADIDPKVLLVGGGHDIWRKKDVIEGFTLPDGEPRITLATLQTASTQDFIRRIQDGAHLMLIIDEVHKSGSPSFSKVLSINAGPRLGLSATPQRYGDLVGTNLILSYFGGVIEPPFTLADAIAVGRLCPYTYHIHPISLTKIEMGEWRSLTREIKRKFAILQQKNPEDMVYPEQIKLLLIKRADISKNAAAKVPLAVQILKQNYLDGHRWLIYCDDQSQLSLVLSSLRDAGFSCDEYHSNMLGNREATLEHFIVVGGILVAIKCLDEGVDIPSIDHALILASSRNPREFIQRRGRVLRKTKDKHFAEIHDALVLPSLDSRESDDMGVLRSELARASQFAASASNEAVKFKLRQLALDIGVEPDQVTSLLDFEVEENGEI